MNVESAVECLTRTQRAVLKELEASARRYEAVENPCISEMSSQEFRGAISDIESGDAVNSSWHPEGYDDVRGYLEMWAPESAGALAHVPDDMLSVAWQRTHMHHECSEAGGRGALIALRAHLERSKAAEADGEEPGF